MQWIAIAMMVVKPEASRMMLTFGLDRESKGSASPKLTRAPVAEASLVKRPDRSAVPLASARVATSSVVMLKLSECIK